MSFSKMWSTLVLSLFIGYYSWEILYFSPGEGFLMGLSICLSFSFIFGWYCKAYSLTKFFNNLGLAVYLFLLPFVPILLYLITLRTVASWDVIDVSPYIVMYMLFGISWLSISLGWVLLLWSFSYEDDVLTKQNPAALALLTGAVVGSSLIYAGANIGDGPGWWSIVYAGGLGMFLWLVLGLLINKTTAIIERILMEFDLNSGIRFAAYLISSGLILARASGGDWISFEMTLFEFLTSWTVIPLVVMMILFEHFIVKNQGNNESQGISRLLTILVSLMYLSYAWIVVLALKSIF